MRIYEFIFEGYKEAQTEFAQLAPTEEVTSTIDAYKALVNKNQVQGNERNIDYWRKQGWDNFKKFVSNKQELPTKTQVKRSKVVGNSITLHEDDKWLIVIPLDKDASCFHGKGSNWCTSRPLRNYFEEYFYDQYAVLIYCLQKHTGNMWAIAGSNELDTINIYNKENRVINKRTFTQQTGLDANELIDTASTFHEQEIESSRNTYNEAIEKIASLLRTTEITDRNPEIEKLLLFTKSVPYITRYAKKLVYHNGRIDLPKELRIPIIAYHPENIQYFIKTTEYEQSVAVKNNIDNFTLINNPTTKICKYVEEHSP
jgi:hypothetical protein